MHFEPVNCASPTDFSVLGVSIFEVVFAPLRRGGGREFLGEVDVHLDVARDVDALRAGQIGSAAGGRGAAARPVLVLAPLVDLQGLLLSPEISSRSQIQNYL